MPRQRPPSLDTILSTTISAFELLLFAGCVNQVMDESTLAAVVLYLLARHPNQSIHIVRAVQQYPRLPDGSDENRVVVYEPEFDSSKTSIPVRFWYTCRRGMGAVKRWAVDQVSAAYVCGSNAVTNAHRIGRVLNKWLAFRSLLAGIATGTQEAPADPVNLTRELGQCEIDDDTLYLVLILLRYWGRHPELDFSQVWQLVYVPQAIFVTLGSDSIGGVSQQLSELLVEKDQIRELLVNFVHQQGNGSFLLADADYFRVLLQQQTVNGMQRGGDHTPREGASIFDEDLLVAIDSFLQCWFQYVEQAPNAGERVARFQRLVVAAMRCGLGYQVQPKNQHAGAGSHSLQGADLLLGYIEVFLFPVLFDQDPQLVGRLLRDDTFIEYAAQIVTRLSARSILSGEVRKIFRSALISEGFGLTDAQNKRLRSSYSRMLHAKDFFRSLLSTSSDAFVSRTFVASGSAVSDTQVHKSLIKNLMRVFLATPSLPVHFCFENEIQSWACAHGVVVSPQQLASFSITGFLQLVYLWSKVDGPQAAMQTWHTDASVVLFCQFISELTYWQTYRLFAAVDTVNVLHKSQDRLIYEVFKHFTDQGASQVGFPKELLELVSYNLLPTGGAQNITQHQSNERRFWELVLYTVTKMKSCSGSGLLSCNNWSLDRLTVMLDSLLYRHPQYAPFYRKWKRLDGDVITRHLLNVLLPDNEVSFIESQFAAVEDLLLLQIGRAPRTLTYLTMQNSQSMQPVAVLMSDQTFDPIAPATLLTWMIDLFRTNRAKLQPLLIKHPWALSQSMVFMAKKEVNLWSGYRVTDKELFLAANDILTFTLSDSGLAVCETLDGLVNSNRKLPTNDFMAYIFQQLMLEKVQAYKKPVSTLYLKHNVVMQVLLLHGMQSNDFFDFIHYDYKVSPLAQADFFGKMLNNYAGGKHADLLDALCAQISRFFKTMGSDSNLVTLLDLVGLVGKTWQNKDFVRDFDFIRKDPFVLACLSSVVRNMDHQSLSLHLYDATILSLLKEYALEYISAFSSMSESRWVAASKALSAFDGYSKQTFSWQVVTNVVLDFLASSPTLINTVLSQLRAEKSAPLRELIARKSVAALYTMVRDNRDTLDRNEAKCLYQIDLGKKDLQDLEKLLVFLLSNTPVHPESGAGKVKGFVAKNHTDFMRELIAAFQETPLLGWNMCMDIFTLPYGQCPRAQQLLQDYFKKIEPCTKDAKSMFLIVMFSKLLTKSWLVPSVVKDSIERLFSKPKKSSWYASVAQIILTVTCIFYAIFHKQYRKDLGRNFYRLRASLWYFFTTPLYFLVYDPKELLVTIIGWLFMPFMLLQNSVQISINAIGFFMYELYEFVVGSIWRSRIRPTSSLPVRQSVENIMWAVFGLGVSMTIMLRTVGFVSLTVEHLTLGATYVACMVMLQNFWPGFKKSTWSILTQSTKEDALPSARLVEKTKEATSVHSTLQGSEPSPEHQSPALNS